MPNALGSIEYTLAGDWTPGTSRIIPWYEDTDASPRIVNDGGGWLTVVRDNKVHDGVVSVRRPQGTPPDVGIDIQITVVAPNNPSVVITPANIVIRRYQKGGTFGGATLAGNVLTLINLDNTQGSYRFDLLLSDGNGNLGLLDPRLTNN